MPKIQSATNVQPQETNDSANASAQQAILVIISKLREELIEKIASTASAYSVQLCGLQDTVEKMSATVEATAGRVLECVGISGEWRFRCY